MSTAISQKTANDTNLMITLQNIFWLGRNDKMNDRITLKFLDILSDEIKLRAENNYGDWFDGDEKLRDENFRANICLAIDEIMNETKERMNDEIADPENRNSKTIEAIIKENVRE